jgi:hypothetical protein
MESTNLGSGPDAFSPVNMHIEQLKSMWAHALVAYNVRLGLKL